MQAPSSVVFTAVIGAAVNLPAVVLIVPAVLAAGVVEVTGVQKHFLATPGAGSSRKVLGWQMIDPFTSMDSANRPLALSPNLTFPTHLQTPPAAGSYCSSLAHSDSKLFVLVALAVLVAAVMLATGVARAGDVVVVVVEVPIAVLVLVAVVVELPGLATGLVVLIAVVGSATGVIDVAGDAAVNVDVEVDVEVEVEVDAEVEVEVDVEVEVEVDVDVAVVMLVTVVAELPVLASGLGVLVAAVVLATSVVEIAGVVVETVDGSVAGVPLVLVFVVLAAEFFSLVVVAVIVIKLADDVGTALGVKVDEAKGVVAAGAVFL